MRRRQLPITLSFTMTFNKSQGQTLNKACWPGLHIQKPVFFHGQLYLTMSRLRSRDDLKIYVPHSNDNMEATTTNVVYYEVFRNLWNILGSYHLALSYCIKNNVVQQEEKV